MAVEVKDMLSRLRDERYTGSNRCGSCTVVNVAITLGVAIAIAVVSIPLATVWVGVGSLAIYLRGYLIPGTPSLTKRYLPHRLRTWVHGGVTEDAEGEQATTEPELEVVERIRRERAARVNPDVYLEEAGIIHTPDGILELTPTFDDLVRSNTIGDEDVTLSAALLAPLFDCTEAELEVRQTDPPKLYDQRLVRNWPSRAALLTDLALSNSISEMTDDWLDVPVNQRLNVIAALRSLVDQCGSCGGSIETTEEWMEIGCCSEREVTVQQCVSCEEVLRRIDNQVDHAKRIGDLKPTS